MSSTRQLAAIMFTDITGYTAIMGKDSAKALELVRNSREIQKPLVEKHGGKWLKEMGDGALAQFNTALDAVNCALEIQRASRADFEGDLRIGIHLGDITIENDDVYGDGVNVASRLESIADAGGIYISDSIEKAIRGQTDVQAKYLGEVNLKNVEYGVRTYALQGVGLPVPDVKEEKELSGRFWAELLRRGVIRAGVVYLLVTSFLILLLREAESWIILPDWSFSALLSILIIGFPIALFLAWNYELSPKGFVRTTSKESWQNPFKGSQRKPLTSNLIIVGLLLVIAFIYIYPHIKGNKDISEEARRNKERSIAVLPFENLSNDPEQVYFADGAAEMIRTRLSKLKELKVTSMRSVIQYRNSDKTIPQIAEELDVSYILEGSVFKAGEQVRAVVQLINPSTDDHLWSESFEGNMLELFDFQAKIARDVADALRIKLVPDTEPGIENSLVYDLILAAGHNMGKLEETDNYNYLVTAEKQYKEALEIEPNNEYVLTGLGWVNYQKSVYGKGEKFIDTARHYAKRVLEINPDNSEVQSLSGILSYNQGRMDDSEDYFRKAMELDPNNSYAAEWLANILQSKEEFEKAIELYLKSFRLDPNNPERARYFYSNIGFMTLYVGMDKEAEKSFLAHQNLYPEDRSSYTGLAWLYLKEGRKEDAKNQIEKHNERVDMSTIDDFNVLDGYAWTNFLVGNYKEARKIYERQYERTRDEFEELENIHHIWRHRYAMIMWQEGKKEAARELINEHLSILKDYHEIHSDNTYIYDIAGAYAFLGNREKAYEWLEKMPNRMFTNFHIQMDPMFDSLRNEKRFQEILTDIAMKRTSLRITVQNLIESEEMKDIMR